MGIDVTDKIVSYNDNHQHLINTSTAGNPKMIVIRGMTIYSVFRRVKHRSLAGDGNPLMYALKKKSNYLINKEEIIRFLPNFYFIIRNFEEKFQGGTIIPIPSSHNIALFLAKRMQRVIPEARLISNLPIKKTCGQVHGELVQGAAPAGHEKIFKQLLALLKKKSNEALSLKDVDVKLRHLISPLTLNVEIQVPDSPILLVDDLIATGTTLLGTHDLLTKNNCKHAIHRLCLLGKL